MKSKELKTTAIILPLLSGVILCILFILIAKPNISTILPLREGVEIAEFDEKATDTAIAQGFDKDTPDNRLVGFITLIGKTINIRYNCDYSNMIGCVSLMNSNVHFGDTGCIYLKALSDTGQILECEKDIDIESEFGNFHYILVDTKKADNEFSILNSTSHKGKSLIIYYQMSDGAGLSSEYKVLMYEEVE